MANEPSSLLPLSMQQELMRRAVECPEDIYAKIKQAEDWLEELKKMARDRIILKVPVGVKSFDIDTPENYIHVTANRGKFKPNKVHEVLASLKIDDSQICALEPAEYGMKAGAFDILEAYLRDNIITQAQFDSMFAKGNHTVTVKPKSNLAIALNAQNGE